MRYWTGGAIVLFLALFQAASVEQFKVLGVAPNVMLVLLVAWTVIRGLDDVLPMIAIAGITLGFVGLQTPGLVLLALLPVAGFGLLREMHIVHSDLLLALILVVVGSLAYESIILAAVALSRGTSDLLLGVRYGVVPATIVNLAITPPIYFIMRLANPSGVRRRLSY
jgi:uncharacterized membrane protein YjgN (DUF898 family)